MGPRISPSRRAIQASPFAPSVFANFSASSKNLRGCAAAHLALITLTAPPCFTWVAKTLSSHSPKRSVQSVISRP